MADDKGSDLDVFEGLTKKKSSGAASLPPQTLRGTGSPPSVPLPPPKRPSGSAIPIPKPPPSKGSSALPKPKPPPSQRVSEAPALSIKPASISGIFDEPSSSANVLPGSAVADLDWDDDEEATNVFDRSASDLFGDLASPSRRMESAAPAKKDVGRAAALLASSGKSAKAIKSTPPPAEMPRIPAPAPVPKEIAESKSQGASARAPHPSWAPAEGSPAVQAGGQKKSSGSTFLLALIAVVAIGAAAFFYLRSSSDATIVIDVVHNDKSVDKANIYIDGQRKCEFAPCTVKLPPGAKSVRVVSGPLAGSKNIDVKGGEDQNIKIVLGVSDETADPVASADTTASAEPEKTGPAAVKITSKMKDAKIKVFINGEEKGEIGKEPLELKDLEPGPVTLRFEGDKKYGKVEKTLDLKPGETLDVADIELPLLEILAAFNLKTRGADVKLMREDDKGKKEEVKLRFRGTKAEAKLDTNYKYTLVANLKGYKELEKVLDFDGVGEKMDMPIELVEQPKDPEPVAATTDGGTKPPPPDAGAKFGIINANSLPPAGVIIDGRPHGTAPVTGVKVTPGSHTVVFRHATLGTKSRTVTVAAGKTATAAVRFDPSSAASSDGGTTSKKKKKGKKGKKKKKKGKKKKGKKKKKKS